MASFSIISPAFSTRKAIVKVTRKFYTFCNLLIVLNALAFGLLTDISIADRIGPELESFCDLSILIFIVELLIRLSLEKGRFFTGRNRYWNWFDTIIVVLSSAAQLGTFSSFRVFRIFRVFRQLNILRVVRSADKLKLIVEAIFNAIPGMLWTTILFVIIMYTYALLGSTFFGNEFPDWFGNVWRSMYSLFQIMTLESWSMGIARPVMDVYPAAWIYFVTYVLIASYVILNIVVALVVSSLQEVTAKNESRKSQKLSKDALQEEIDKLRQQIDVVNDMLKNSK
ncbi:ion transporter [Duncaniella sp.]|uniref:ion transporter n=1 Tax=Duncaniella sp. TaxID=2518496 RepID=UPI0023C09A55|nr:ion transporter [Duncaniella sp.]MDE5905305.1 ion transporter [Duncaniella sp.]